jgi:hypothetical protein
MGSYIFQVYTKVLDKVAKGPITWSIFNPGVELYQNQTRDYMTKFSTQG